MGFSTFVWLMKHSTPARVSTYAYVNPLVAVFLGWLILGEPVTARTLAAAAVIVVSVAVITTQRGRNVAPRRVAAFLPRRSRACSREDPALGLKTGRSSATVGSPTE